MARVTVEDCLAFVKNRFDLVLKASKRAHALELGAASPLVPPQQDKFTVIALREIAAGLDITKTRVHNELDETDAITRYRNVTRESVSMEQEDSNN